MGAIELRAVRVRNQPATRNWNATNLRDITAHFLFPLDEIHRPRKRRQHYKLRKGQVRTLGDTRGGGKRFQSITRQSEDEGAEYMDAVLAKRAQPVYQCIPGKIEVLVDIFQTLRRDRLHPDECALD